MTELKAPPTKEEQEKLIVGILKRYQAYGFMGEASYDPDEYIVMKAAGKDVPADADKDCEIVVYYDGCGDEGMVGRDAYSGGFEQRFPHAKQPNKAITLTQDEEDAFAEFLYTWLSDRSPGWEINEGSSGTAHFYIHGDRISLYCNHDVNVMEVRSGVLR
tara:strand:+ start:1303 stop:1782 length:480 start_codon:yes stop_codon:yes gene_type:complete